MDNTEAVDFHSLTDFASSMNLDFSSSSHKHHRDLWNKCLADDLKTKLETARDKRRRGILPHNTPFPHFHRCQIITGSDLPIGEDTAIALRKIGQCLFLREKYMKESYQSFPEVVSQYLHAVRTGKYPETLRDEIHERQNRAEINVSSGRDYVPCPSVQDPWNVKLPANLHYTSKMENGIVAVYDLDEGRVNFQYPTYDRFVKDLTIVWENVMNGPTRSFTDKRLTFLRSRFDIHVNLNEVYELADMSAVAHRDFYNVLKVDTHIHAAACMTPSVLLERIHRAALEDGNLEVIGGKTKDDPPITLNKLFYKLELDPAELSVNSLDVHADRSTMNRFDRFDHLYNVAGESELRQLFLKPTNNKIKGRYFGEMIGEILRKHEKELYNATELRISPGGSLHEWKELAEWAMAHNLYSVTNQWVIQIPRCYPEKRRAGKCQSFEGFMAEAFLPLFLATSNPQDYPEIATFLQYVCAFDSVSDESIEEVSLLSHNLPTPDQWTSDQNPPYSYYLYYMHANLCILNKFRQLQGLKCFALRPHSGESGSPLHLAAAFLLAENISHGIQLKENPSLEYLYFMAQIPIALSPLSNNALFLPYLKHPLKDFFAEGIPVSLSTDDPLMFHITKDPLSEEYAIAAQVFGLSACDMCELARNSVIMSGLPEEAKCYWLGKNYKHSGILGNDIGCTNVPDVRVAYRFETHITELFNLVKFGQNTSNA